MTGGEREADIDAKSEGTTDTSTQESAENTAGTAKGHGDRDAQHGGDDGDGRENGRSSLAAYVRDAVEREESEAELVERVRASYEFDISRRRVRRLVEAERDRIERDDTALVVAGHAPRYVDLGDLTYLTDAEFGRVIASVIGEHDGHSEVVSDTEPADSSADTAGAGDVASTDGVSDAAIGREHQDSERIVGSEAVDGTDIRWHRAEGTVLVRAVAAEPGRAVDADLVRRVREKDRTVHATNGDTESADTAIVTVANIVPGAVRLAVRSGIEIYDRADVRRWLDEARLETETFGSLIDGS